MEMITLKPSLKFRRAELSAQLYEGYYDKTFAIAASVAGVVLLLGAIAFGLRGLAYSKPANNFNMTAVSATSSSAVDPLMLEVHIANNGLIFMRGARVTAVDGGTIETVTSWGDTRFAWIVETNGATKFLNHQGQKQIISEIKVGDFLSVTGKLVSDSNRLIINAEFVRE